jgi:hypothetical protein
VDQVKRHGTVARQCRAHGVNESMQLSGVADSQQAYPWDS